MTSPAASAPALRGLAEDLARQAGETARAGRRNLPIGQPPGHDTKSSATDPVTAFDEAAEATIVEALRRLRPDDAIVGEEGTTDAGTSSIEWHIDPIDGTANFLYDQPAWCTSIAAVDDRGPLAGAVFAPVADELFSAARDHGATLNGEPIRVTGAAALATSLVGTGFSYLPERRAVQAERLRRLLPAVRDVRRLGSAALDLCYVACGRLDAYFEEHLNSWDLAAGMLIAVEAGAITTDLDGRPALDGAVLGDAVLASSPGIHDLLLDAIRDASAEVRH